MSYILEALRKSERQRRASEGPPAARLAAEPPRPATRRRSLVIGLSVLANIALLLYLALGVSSRTNPESGAKSGEKHTQMAAEPAPAQQAPAPESSKRSAPAVVPAGSDSNARLPAKPKALAASPPTKAAPQPRARRGQLPTPPTATPSSDGHPDSAETIPKRPPVAAGLPSQRLPSMAPQRHPEMEVDTSPSEAGFTRPKINVYAYSNRNDADRFVIISHRKYREGDRIEDGGATVKRIEEHAMTIEYQGQTYKVPRP